MPFGKSSRFLTAAAVLFLGSCVSKSDRAARAPEPHLDTVTPDKVMAGDAFQQQADGRSALSVMGQNLLQGARVRLNGKPLETAFGDGKSLSAIVPPQLTNQEGIYPVSVESPDGQVSNSVPLVVLPRTGPVPEIKQLYPEATEVGKPFNEQPGGLSALGIVGVNFLPGATIEVNGEPLKTSFMDVDKVAAIMPGKFLSKPATLKIAVRNKDGKVSNVSSLELTAPAAKK